MPGSRLMKMGKAGGGIMAYRLTGDGLDQRELAHAGEMLGLPVVGGPSTAADAVRLLPEGAAMDLAGALRGRCAAIVEYAEDTLPTGALSAALQQGHLLVSLTTRLAWTLDTAAQFCEGLLARGMLTGLLRHDVELSLHEAIINAVLHGNLALGSSLVDDPAEFDAFCHHLTTTLADPVKARKRVDLYAWVADGFLYVRVSDQGGGYDPAAVQYPTNPEAKSGRGLEIMRIMSSGLTVSDGGRTATLRYAL
jgi:anti-sigma regulatory factor (Ser/Thr protein kinase)